MEVLDDVGKIGPSAAFDLARKPCAKLRQDSMERYRLDVMWSHEVNLSWELDDAVYDLGLP